MQPKTDITKSFGYTTQIKDLTIVTQPKYYYLTSTIYPLEFLDSLTTSPNNVDGRSSHKDDLGVQRFNQDSTKIGLTEISGTLKVALKVYNYSRTEADIDKITSSMSGVTGTLRLLLISNKIKPDTFKVSFNGVTGTLRSALIAYMFYKQENILHTLDKVEGVYEKIQTSFETYVKGSKTILKSLLVLNNVKTVATLSTVLNFETTPPIETDGYNLIFKSPLKEVDSHNVILIFGRKQSNLPKDPEVIVNEYTTSALDFENGLIDKIPTTIWKGEVSGYTVDTSDISPPGLFDFYLDDMNTPLYTNITELELKTLLENNSDIEVEVFKKYTQMIIYMTEINNAARYALQEVEVASTPGGPDITFTTMPTGQSSYFGSSRAFKLVDRNYTNFEYNIWETPDTTTPEWVQFDFQKEVLFEEVRIYPQNWQHGPSRAPKKLTIRGLNTKSVWEDIMTYENVTGWIQGKAKIFNLLDGTVKDQP